MQITIKMKDNLKLNLQSIAYFNFQLNIKLHFYVPAESQNYIGFDQSFGLTEWRSDRLEDCNCKVMILYLEIISDDKLPYKNLKESVTQNLI